VFTSKEDICNKCMKGLIDGTIKRRKCLKCDEEFLSINYNRTCDNCKKNNWRYDFSHEEGYY